MAISPVHALFEIRRFLLALLLAGGILAGSVDKDRIFWDFVKLFE